VEEKAKEIKANKDPKKEEIKEPPSLLQKHKMLNYLNRRRITKKQMKLWMLIWMSIMRMMTTIYTLTTRRVS
jgi:hypothetical protein